MHKTSMLLNSVLSLCIAQVITSNLDDPDIHKEGTTPPAGSLVRSKCEDASDCMSHEVCYLPTNECKEQLTLSLTERSTCSTKDDCKENEMCYLNTKTCVCDLHSVEVLGACTLLKNQDCNSPQVKKFRDANGWEVVPYCNTWSNKSTKKEQFLGSYSTGSGVSNDLMEFKEGSSEHCGYARVAKMMYECYCDEYSCNSTTSYDTVNIFIGEFDPCVYTFYIFSPLACTDYVA